MDKRKCEYVFWICNTFFILGTMIFLCAFFIRDKYGELVIAVTNEEFMNFLQNKRKLFLLQVCVPTLCMGVLILITYFLFLKKRKDFTKNILSLITIVISVGLLIFSWNHLQVSDYLQKRAQQNRTHWYDNEKIVIHALGDIDGDTYTNSVEALYRHYELDNKVFECDFLLTSDQKLVACHDWDNRIITDIPSGYVPLKSEFMQSSVFGKYTPMSIDEIVLFMKAHPEVYIVTDTKYAEKEKYEIQLQAIVDACKNFDCEELIDHFLIQIYHPYMYDDIEAVYPFENVIFTLYQEGYRGDFRKLEEYALFCYQNNIQVVTMNEMYYNDEALAICDKYGIQLFVHTVNDENRQNMFLEKGIGIYTDLYGAKNDI